MLINNYAKILGHYTEDTTWIRKHVPPPPIKVLTENGPRTPHGSVEKERLLLSVLDTEILHNLCRIIPISRPFEGFQ